MNRILGIIFFYYGEKSSEKHKTGNYVIERHCVAMIKSSFEIGRAHA